MKKKTIKSSANLFLTTLAGYEPRILNEYLNKIEQDLKLYAKELNLIISCHVEYIPINYNEAIKNQEFKDKIELSRKEIMQTFKLPHCKLGETYYSALKKDIKNKIDKECDLQRQNEIKWLQKKIKELRKGKDNE